MKGETGEDGEDVGVVGGYAGDVVEVGHGADCFGDYVFGGEGAGVVLLGLLVEWLDGIDRLSHTWTPRPMTTSFNVQLGSGAGRGVGATGCTARERSHVGGLAVPSCRAIWTCLSTRA